MTDNVDIEAAVETARKVQRLHRIAHELDDCNGECYEIANALIALADREKRLAEMAREWQKKSVAAEADWSMPDWGATHYAELRERSSNYENCAHALLRELGVEVSE